MERNMSGLLPYITEVLELRLLTVWTFTRPPHLSEFLPDSLVSSQW